MRWGWGRKWINGQNQVLSPDLIHAPPHKHHHLKQRYLSALHLWASSLRFHSRLQISKFCFNGNHLERVFSMKNQEGSLGIWTKRCGQSTVPGGWVKGCCSPCWNGCYRCHAAPSEIKNFNKLGKKVKRDVFPSDISLYLTWKCGSNPFQNYYFLYSKVLKTWFLLISLPWQKNDTFGAKAWKHGL